MAKYFIKMKHFHHCALGIEAVSFWSAAEKDIAESPTAQPERPREMSTVNRLRAENKSPQLTAQSSPQKNLSSLAFRL